MRERERPKKERYLIISCFLLKLLQIVENQGVIAQETELLDDRLELLDQGVGKPDVRLLLGGQIQVVLRRQGVDAVVRDEHRLFLESALRVKVEPLGGEVGCRLLRLELPSLVQPRDRGHCARLLGLLLGLLLSRSLVQSLVDRDLLTLVASGISGIDLGRGLRSGFLRLA